MYHYYVEAGLAWTLEMPPVQARMAGSLPAATEIARKVKLCSLVRAARKASADCVLPPEHATIRTLSFMVCVSHLGTQDLWHGPNILPDTTMFVQFLHCEVDISSQKWGNSTALRPYHGKPSCCLFEV